MKKKLLSIAFAGTLALGACAQGPGGYGERAAPGQFGLNKTTGGTLLGAGLGGLAGAQFGSGKGQLAMTALGVLGGALLGSEVGKSLDKADLEYARRTTQTSLETSRTGVTSSWANPDTGARGTVTPTRTYTANSGNPCREYTQTITVGGKTEQGVGTACRQPDGSWRIQN
jgi:surface antigen